MLKFLSPPPPTRFKMLRNELVAKGLSFKETPGAVKVPATMNIASRERV